VVAQESIRIVKKKEGRPKHQTNSNTYIDLSTSPCTKGERPSTKETELAQDPKFERIKTKVTRKEG
jgi:hypothetical protein